MPCHPESSLLPAGALLRTPRLKVLLYNRCAVFFTMSLALLAIGSQLDPSRDEVVIVDGRLEADPEQAVLAQLGDALCLGVTVLTGAEAVQRGYRLPETLQAWALFDHVAGEPAPWVWMLANGVKRLLQPLERYRCSKDGYHWPLEMLFSRALMPTRKLS
jgi:hypothetical protein